MVSTRHAEEMMPELRLPSAREVENLAILEHFCLEPEPLGLQAPLHDDRTSRVPLKHVHWMMRMVAMQLL